MLYEGTYRSLIQGVSQQTPQERLDGQLGAQVNMLSDPVNGLRRRTGFKLHGRLDVPNGTKFELVQLAGEYFIQAVTPDGRLVITRFNDMQTIHDSVYPYLVNNSKGTIRYTMSQNRVYVLNTEKVPTKVLQSEAVIQKLSATENSRRHWVKPTGTLIVAGVFNTRGIAYENLRVQASALGLDVTITVNYPYPEGGVYNLATRINNMYNALIANSTITANFTVSKSSDSIALLANTPTDTYVLTHSITGETTTTSTAKGYTSTGTIQLGTVATDLPTTYTGHYFTNGSTYLYDSVRQLWVLEGSAQGVLNPKYAGWVRVLSGAFSKTYSVAITQGSGSTLNYSVTTHASTASQATPEYVATQLQAAMNADTNFTTNFEVHRTGTSLAILAKNATEQLVLESYGGDIYIVDSGASIIKNKDLLPPTLPVQLDNYIQGIGTVGNLSYYQYTHSTRTWKECGAYEQRYVIQNAPIFWYYDYGTESVIVEALDIKGRNAGDDDNNPEPSFLDFGITGISAYQSRLIFLSGAYVCMSRSNDPTTFMRTTVTELLDDDAIEISATALSNSQFEYAIPYNKDLILFSNTQQAVIPANNTVLTPKSAVIYPSTQSEVSLAVKPIAAARSLYYVYQRGLDYYQVGELIPNQYTDAQYNPQNLTDHLPLYALGVCTGMAGSSTNNMVAFTSDSPDVLINQFVWQGDTRNIMGFHKWVLPRKVLDTAFLQEYNILFVEDTDGNTLVLTTNTQLNQLGTKPVPFLDIYQYVETDANGVGYLDYVPDGDLVGVVYDDVNSRHMEVQVTVQDGVVTSNHVGTIAIGLRYTSLFTLTPPYLKDQDGNVLAGVKSTVQSFLLTLRGTGEFKYVVNDFAGAVSSVDTSAATWSEVNLGYTWINSVSTTVVPCRSRLDGLTCTIQTDSTTDLNLTTAGYVLRTAKKHSARR